MPEDIVPADWVVYDSEDEAVFREPAPVTHTYGASTISDFTVDEGNRAGPSSISYFPTEPKSRPATTIETAPTSATSLAKKPNKPKPKPRPAYKVSVPSSSCVCDTSISSVSRSDVPGVPLSSSLEAGYATGDTSMSLGMDFLAENTSVDAAVSSKQSTDQRSLPYDPARSKSPALPSHPSHADHPPSKGRRQPSPPFSPAIDKSRKRKLIAAILSDDDDDYNPSASKKKAPKKKVESEKSKEKADKSKEKSSKKRAEKKEKSKSKSAREQKDAALELGSDDIIILDAPSPPKPPKPPRKSRESQHVFKSSEFIDDSSDDDLALLPPSVSVPASKPASVPPSEPVSVPPSLQVSAPPSEPLSGPPSVSVFIPPSILCPVTAKQTGITLPRSPQAVIPTAPPQVSPILSGPGSRQVVEDSQADGLSKKKKRKSGDDGAGKPKKKKGANDAASTKDTTSEGLEVPSISTSAKAKSKPKKGAAIPSEDENDSIAKDASASKKMPDKPPRAKGKPSSNAKGKGRAILSDSELSELEDNIPDTSKGKAAAAGTTKDSPTSEGPSKDEQGSARRDKSTDKPSSTKTRAKGKESGNKENTALSKSALPEASSSASEQTAAPAPIPSSSSSTPAQTPKSTKQPAMLRKGSMAELISRVNSRPDSPFGARSKSMSATYSPFGKSSRNALMRIAPLHPNRRTPPPPPPRAPAPKKSKKMLQLEEKWEEELSETVDGWTTMSSEERALLMRAKRDQELGYDD